jgi:hypothetical protein
MVKIGGGKPTVGGNVGEAHQGVHDRELSRGIEFESWYPPSARENGRRRQFPQLTSVDEGFQYVLLDIVVVVDDLRHPLAKMRKVLDILVDTVVVHVIGGWLGSQDAVVANVLLGEAVSVVTADYRIGQVEMRV